MCNDRNLKKSMAGILAVLFLAITLFSSVYIIIESDHDCSGEDCHICHMIEVCEALLQRIEHALSSFTAVIFLCLAFIILRVVRSNVSLSKTLFDLKVRLNS